MGKIGKIKLLKEKIETFVKEKKISNKPQTLDEAIRILLNFIVKEKRELSLLGKAHKLTSSNIEKANKISKLFPLSEKKTKKNYK